MCISGSISGQPTVIYFNIYFLHLQLPKCFWEKVNIRYLYISPEWYPDPQHSDVVPPRPPSLFLIFWAHWVLLVLTRLTSVSFCLFLAFSLDLLMASLFLARFSKYSGSSLETPRPGVRGILFCNKPRSLKETDESIQRHCFTSRKNPLEIPGTWNQEPTFSSIHNKLLIQTLFTLRRLRDKVLPRTICLEKPHDNKNCIEYQEPRWRN